MKWRPSILQFLSLCLHLSSKTIACVARSPHTRSLRCFSHCGPCLNYHPLLACVKAKKSMLELHRQQLPHSREGSPGSVCAVGTQSYAVSSTARGSISEAPRCVHCRSTPRGFQPVSCLHLIQEKEIEKGNKDQPQGCWDWRCCRWNLITLKVQRGLCWF